MTFENDESIFCNSAENSDPDEIFRSLSQNEAETHAVANVKDDALNLLNIGLTTKYANERVIDILKEVLKKYDKSVDTSSFREYFRFDLLVGVFSLSLMLLCLVFNVVCYFMGYYSGFDEIWQYIIEVVLLVPWLAVNCYVKVTVKRIKSRRMNERVREVLDIFKESINLPVHVELEQRSFTYDPPSSSLVPVYRDLEWRRLPVNVIVRGDVFKLSVGALYPCDCRMIEKCDAEGRIELSKVVKRYGDTCESVGTAPSDVERLDGTFIAESDAFIPQLEAFLDRKSKFFVPNLTPRIRKRNTYETFPFNMKSRNYQQPTTNNTKTIWDLSDTTHLLKMRLSIKQICCYFLVVITIVISHIIWNPKNWTDSLLLLSRCLICLIFPGFEPIVLLADIWGNVKLQSLFHWYHEQRFTKDVNPQHSCSSSTLTSDSADSVDSDMAASQIPLSNQLKELGTVFKRGLDGEGNLITILSSVTLLCFVDDVGILTDGHGTPQEISIIKGNPRMNKGDSKKKLRSKYAKYSTSHITSRTAGPSKMHSSDDAKSSSTPDNVASCPMYMSSLSIASVPSDSSLTCHAETPGDNLRTKGVNGADDRNIHSNTISGCGDNLKIKKMSSFQSNITQSVATLNTDQGYVTSIGGGEGDPMKGKMNLNPSGSPVFKSHCENPSSELEKGGDLVILDVFKGSKEHGKHYIRFNNNEERSCIPQLQPLTFAMALTQIPRYYYPSIVRQSPELINMYMGMVTNQHLIDFTDCMCALAGSVGLRRPFIRRFKLLRCVVLFDDNYVDGKLLIFFLRDFRKQIVQMIVKGKLEMILDRNSNYHTDGKIFPINKFMGRKLKDLSMQWISSGMTPCAYAYKPIHLEEFNLLMSYLPSNSIYKLTGGKSTIRKNRVYMNVCEEDPIHMQFKGACATEWSKFFKRKTDRGSNKLIINRDRILGGFVGNMISSCIKNTILLGMCGTKRNFPKEVPSRIQDFHNAGIRFVYFSKDNEKQTRIFGSLLGLETSWNSMISLSASERYVEKGSSSTKRGKPKLLHLLYLLVIPLYLHFVYRSSCVNQEGHMVLPNGIENIYKHIEEVDDIPLQVSLFCNCTVTNTVEMLRILRESGETIMCVGGGLIPSNFFLFNEAQCSFCVASGYHPICRFCKGKRWEGIPRAHIFEEPLPEFKLSSALTSLPCALQTSQMYKVSDPYFVMEMLFEVFKEARRMATNIQESGAFTKLFYSSLVWMFFLQSVLNLPPVLQSLDLSLIMYVYIPLISISLLSNPTTDHIMQYLPSKRADESYGTVWAFIRLHSRTFVVTTLATLVYCIYLCHFESGISNKKCFVTLYS